MDKPVLNRRNFIKTGAILGGGLLIGFSVPLAGRPGKSSLTGIAGGFSPNAFLNVSTDNKITVLLTHVEMGQGVWTTLSMLIADELDVDIEKIEVIHSPAGKHWNHTVFGVQITGGSSSTWSEFDRYRQAGATARTLLTQAAAKRMKVAPETCTTGNGYVISGNTKISYGEVAEDAALLSVPAEVPLRSKDKWRYIGKGSKRLDGPAKTNGSAIYGIDVKFPGLLTAVVAHAPVFGGKVKSFDADKAKAVPGVKQIVQIPGGIAVIADHYWSAMQGRKALKIEWDLGEGAKMNSDQQLLKYKELAKTNGLPAAEKGNAVTGLSKATQTVQAEYVFPYLAHATMEPLNCTVRISQDHCEIWTGTQMPATEQEAAAKILKLRPDQVVVNTVFLGGGFGRRATTTADFVSEAVEIAKASGKFIKMVWSREDDLKAGYYRPFFVHHVNAGLGADGLPVAWQHNIVGQSIMAGTPFEAMIQNGIDDSSVEGISNSPYVTATPDHFVGLHTTKEVVPVLWYRSVGHTHTAYVMETIIDQLAHTAKKDPLEYRRGLLKHHPRHLAALNLAAEKSGWSKPLAAGRFKGIAVHESFASYVAQVVEISMVNGLPKIHTVTCAIDCGLAVNPDGVKAQMESGIIFAITMAVYGEITLKNGEVQQNNFYDYKISRLNESPEINVHIVESNEKMGGAGECGVPPMAPALANAVFAATGQRICHLPMSKAFAKLKNSGKETKS
jgi:isoquinoline 1-oxidoreductase beta subunit